MSILVGYFKCFHFYFKKFITIKNELMIGKNLSKENMNLRFINIIIIIITGS